MPFISPFFLETEYYLIILPFYLLPSNLHYITEKVFRVSVDFAFSDISQMFKILDPSEPRDHEKMNNLLKFCCN